MVMGTIMMIPYHYGIWKMNRQQWRTNSGLSTTPCDHDYVIYIHLKKIYKIINNIRYQKKNGPSVMGGKLLRKRSLQIIYSRA